MSSLRNLIRLRASTRPLKQASRVNIRSMNMTSSYHTTSFLCAYTDDQDRNSLKPHSTEGSKSGTDQDVAEQDDAAFNPDKTSPEAAKESAGTGMSGESPLEVSGANPGVSKPQGDSKQDENTATTSQETKKKSGQGASVKKGSPS